MAGVGMYKGRKSVALGLAYYPNENTLFHTGVSYGGSEDLLANIGLSIRFGSHADKEELDKRNRLMPRYAEGPMASVYLMQEEMTAMQKENEVLREKAKAADERANRLEDEMEKMKKQIAWLMAQK